MIFKSTQGIGTVLNNWIVILNYWNNLFLITLIIHLFIITYSIYAVYAAFV